VIDTFNEKHFDLKQVANLLKVSRETARNLVKNEPGVIRIRMGKKQARTTYTTPESVLRRIYAKLTA
jgi:hypothetical protein